MVAGHMPLAALGIVSSDEIVDAFTFFTGFAVDVEHAVYHLDLVARQADHALDVVGLVVARQLEHDHVAAVGLLGPDAPGEQVGPEREGIAAVAVAVFRHEQIVADEQRRDHRARRNVEGLEQEDPHEKRKDQRVDDDADGVLHAASALPSSSASTLMRKLSYCLLRFDPLTRRPPL